MSDTTTDGIHGRIAELAPWFYDHELPGGVTTAPGLPEDLKEIHETRAKMLHDAIGLLGSEVVGSAIDVGCHEGNFSFELLKAGFERVLGVDVRHENLAKARFVAERRGLADVAFQQVDAEELDRDLEPERFDVALVFGLIYHLESPMRVLRQIASRTEHAMIIETQLCPEPGDRGFSEPGSDAAPMEVWVEWGRQGHKLRARGGFAVIDESPMHATNTETGATPLALCPSADAVVMMCRALGFTVDRIDPPEGGHEQLLRARRGVFLARRDR